jgi:hypothetical protein
LWHGWAGPDGERLGQASAINGEITGTVTDPSGAAVAGAAVQITNTDTGFKQSGKSGDNGLYRFTVLPLGTYEVQVQATGFGAIRSTGNVVTAGAIATVDIKLPVAGTTTMVDVTASAAITEPSRIDLGVTLSENMTRNLPLVSRNLQLHSLQPNASGRPNTGSAYHARSTPTASTAASTINWMAAITRRATARASA